MSQVQGILRALERGTLLLDGGMATSLQRLGLPVGDPAIRWNIDRPEAVKIVHESFLSAGSQVIQTNSFGGNTIALERAGLSSRRTRLNLAAARLAREAVDSFGSGLVAGNIGPTGLYYDTPAWDAAPQVRTAFLDQAAALAEGGVDYFALETFSDPDEARLAIAAVREVSALPFTACFTFEPGEDTPQTTTGEPIEQATALLAAEGACAVGLNCATGSRPMLDVAGGLIEKLSVPVIFKPNAGLPELAQGRPLYEQDPEEFATHLVELVGLGASAVGGCCGCGVEFITATANRLAPG
jgi:5-methyltetrahydrofolate--homocysteine methyltransferase